MSIRPICTINYPLTNMVNRCIIKLTTLVNDKKGMIKVFTNFAKLDKEKKIRIINAALKEFGTKGYDNASTNNIVKEADISKGILFHYFKNKRQLFLYLYDYCVEVCSEEIYKKIDQEERDIIKRLQQISLIKLGLLRIYPGMTKFVEVAYLENSPDIKSEIDEKNKKLVNESYTKVFNNIDATMFKDGVDVNKAINMILWTFEGIAESEQKKLSSLSVKEIDYDRLFKESEEYIEIFRKAFYKDNI